MIELPRAALRAGDIAKSAEFFSFGTNDLTQTTYGLSRDNSGTFLGDYLAQGIFDIDPFVSLDPEGVGELVQIAADRGRKTRPGIKLGICGEHGGDPASIEICEKVGLDYVPARHSGYRSRGLRQRRPLCARRVWAGHTPPRKGCGGRPPASLPFCKQLVAGSALIASGDQENKA